ncbi:hypothetical protein [Alienimonas sp. DA493]|uniref:hypothetical protein n=1 Tax=Alienimonas sp. DA493 TaxID=3373605 RepID=UPI0037552B10
MSARQSVPPAYALPPSGGPAGGLGRGLAEGDRATVAGFRAELPRTRYAARAELLRGIVRLNDLPPTPRRKALAEALQAWTRQYEVETPGVVRATEVRITLSSRDELFADAALYAPADGRCTAVTERGTGLRLEGPPTVVVCAAETDRDRDLPDRIDALREGGVTEFVLAGARGGLQWFRLDDDPRRPDRGDGYLKSAALPGLWLPEAVLDPDPAKVDVVAAVRAGCGTLDHAMYVNSLCGGAGRKAR